MPVLDLKVWSENREGQDGKMRNKIIHEFYQKEVSSKTVTHSQSAMSMQTKRNILTAEMLRVLLRCSPLLDWQITAAHASEMNRRIQNAGYSQQFRKQVTEAALNTYKNILTKIEKENAPYIETKHGRNKREIRKSNRINQHGTKETAKTNQSYSFRQPQNLNYKKNTKR